jgi:paraquat-inducible protein A
LAYDSAPTCAGRFTEVSFQMKTYPHFVVCGQCDSVYKRRAGRVGDEARCATCGALLYRGGHVDLDSWLALTIAAAICFAIANLSPVIRLSLESLHNDATLWQAARALANGPAGPMAVPLALSIIVVPTLQIGLLGWALAFARTGRRAPGFALALRMLVALRPWSMVEVGLLGILVAAIKLSSYMHVLPTPGLWATGASMVLLTMITHRDLRVLWDATEAVPVLDTVGETA